MCETKRCSCCGEDKLATGEFWHRRRRNKDGWNEYCKVCVSAKQRIIYRNSSENKKAKAREYVANNPVWKKEYDRIYAQLNKDKIKIIRDRFYDNHPDYLEDRRARRSEGLLPKIILSEKHCPGCNTTYPSNNFYPCINSISGLNTYCKICRCLMASIRRKIIVKGNVVTADIHNLIDSQNNSCEYCTVSFSLEGVKFDIEHKTPISKGGTHAVDNICLACTKCNRSKNNLTDVEFRKSERLERIIFYRLINNQLW